MLKYWYRAFASFAIAISCTCAAAGMMKIIKVSKFAEPLLDIFNFWSMFLIPALYILGLCLVMIAIVKEIKANASAYVIFACTDAVLAALITIYALHDIFIDADIPSGFLGPLLIGTVVRAAAGLFVLDMIVWLCDRLKKKYRENEDEGFRGREDEEGRRGQVSVEEHDSRK